MMMCVMIKYTILPNSSCALITLISLCGDYKEMINSLSNEYNLKLSKQIAAKKSAVPIFFPAAVLTGTIIYLDYI